jgi:HK97 family phage portal protein
MGLFKRKEKSEINKKQVRSIIQEYYGGNASYFAFNYAANIYNIPEVRTAIELFCDIFTTIPIYHERKNKNGDIEYLSSSTHITLSLISNPLQNSSKFWKALITQLMLYGNSFAEPIFEGVELKGIYPLPFKNHKFELFKDFALVKFLDAGQGSKSEYNLSDLIYLNRFSNLTGGQKTNLGLYETVIQALEGHILNVTNPKRPRALLQNKQVLADANIKKEDKKGIISDVKASLDDNIDGLAYLESRFEVTPINWQDNDVNKGLMSFCINVVYNYFGMTESIINNKASEIEYQMFITNRIKPLVRQIEQEFTSKLFTKRERDCGNCIEFDIFALNVSTLQAKTALFGVASRQGLLCIDEMREYLGQAPLPNGLGKMYRVSGDTINLEKVDEYQAAQKGVSKENTKKEDKKNDE